MQLELKSNSIEEKQMQTCPKGIENMLISSSIHDYGVE
jgi:hypothetical protein